MKALLVAVNAKYIHTSLSVRTLKAYANSDNVEMAEYTINERVEDILRSIFLKKADVVLFSCYIWNVEVCLDVADMLKKVSPETKIIFGGPEVSFDDTEYMQKYDFIDAIMRGEGEATFKEWLEIGETADGITYRENGEIKDDFYKNIADYFEPGDTLVLNDTKVIKARLFVRKESGAEREIVILERHSYDSDWFHHKVMYRGKIKAGDKLTIDASDAIKPFAYERH